MRYRKIPDQELFSALTELPGWQVRDGKLHKQFKFRAFEAAIAWMTQVASEVTRLDHHPEWCNIYNQVTVDLVTHDLGNTISNLDITLAKIMDSVVVNDIVEGRGRDRDNPGISKDSRIVVNEVASSISSCL